MVDYPAQRAKIEAKIARAHQLKFAEKVSRDTCVHEWHKYKETIRSERTDEQLIRGYVYSKGPAYFIVLVCEKCKAKRRIDYVVG